MLNFGFILKSLRIEPRISSLQNISEDLIFWQCRFLQKTNSEAIVASASDIIRSGGLASLSMRTLAGRLGVRASSLYRHFPDRSSIERTLALQTAEKLLTQMRQAAEGQRGERAILAASRSYLDFATAEPSFYEIDDDFIFD